MIETDLELLDTLERKLGRFAARWRGTEDHEKAAAVVRQYQAMLRCMIELGYRSELYVDSELPDRLMPQEYLDLFA